MGYRGMFLLVGLCAMRALRDPSCGTDSSAGGLNTPCTRSSDCQGGLTCSGAVCVAVDSGGAEAGEPADAHAADAAGAE